MSVYVSILKQWIIDPIQNSIVAPIFSPSIQTILLLPDILSIFKHLLKCVLVPIKTQICYPFKCNSYVDKLKKQTEKLKEKRDSLDQSVVEAAEALIQSKEEAKMNKCFFGLCPNLKSRYQLSKEADKKASAIDKLLHQEGLHSILERSVYSREALPSRMLLLNQVMDALKDPDLYEIGIYGLGGVGKTSLAKEVQRKAMEEKMFKPVVLVPVSQTPDLRRIQGEIADSVGLKFDAREVPGRAIQLKERLKKSKVLIILDDIWTEFELNYAGIPLKDECKGSKVLFTSRSHDILSREMGTQKEFLIEVLGDEETWKLFQQNLEDANNPEVQAIAIQVSKKCSGLPLLVNIVAADLKKLSACLKNELSAWRVVLAKLSDLENEDIHGKVHKVLKSSFENLPSKEAKSLFLLCSLFGQSNIPTNHLLTYAMGLGLFKNIVGVEQARDRLCQTIEKLKTESLLLDGDMNGHVKMHDVVRDFARSIATKDHHAFFGITGNGLMQLWPDDENCTRIVLHHCYISELPEGVEYPNAELLSVVTEDLNLVVRDLFFKGIRKLRVLNLTGMRLMALPSSPKFLTNLHSLYMHQCRLKDVAIIGGLKQLEFLSFEESHIVELPAQLGELTQLKSLNLTKCSYLKVIPPNVLRKLSRLEELYMDRSFDRWDGNGNASLMELEELRQLTTLEVQASDPKRLPNQLFSKSLERYRISIGNEYWNWRDNLEALIAEGSEDGICNPRKVSSEIQTDTAIFPNLQTMDVSQLGNLEYIWHGQFADDDSFCKLKSLKIEKCSKLKAVFATSKNVMRRFQILEDLEIWDCDEMEVIYQMEELGSVDAVAFELRHLEIQYMPSLNANGVFTFANLKSVEVSNCDVLKYIFPESIASGLSQLEELKVEKCKMKHVVGNTKSGEPYNFRWPKLKHFQLIKNSQTADQLLSQLAKIAMASLEELVIDWDLIKYIVNRKNQPDFFSKLQAFKLNGFQDESGVFPFTRFPNRETFDMDDFLVIRDPNVSEDEYLMNTNDFQTASIFQNLQRLEVYECGRLHILTPSSVYFRNLTYLEVSKCNEMINLITVSTARSLVLLRRMIIRQCKRILEIISKLFYIPIVSFIHH